MKVRFFGVARTTPHHKNTYHFQLVLYHWNERPNGRATRNANPWGRRLYAPNRTVAPYLSGSSSVNILWSNFNTNSAWIVRIVLNCENARRWKVGLKVGSIPKRIGTTETTSQTTRPMRTAKQQANSIVTAIEWQSTIVDTANRIPLERVKQKRAQGSNEWNSSRPDFQKNRERESYEYRNPCECSRQATLMYCRETRPGMTLLNSESHRWIE